MIIFLTLILMGNKLLSANKVKTSDNKTSNIVSMIELISMVVMVMIAC